MSLEKYSDLELSRLLRNLLDGQKSETIEKGESLLNEYNLLPSQYEFDLSMKEHKKQLEKVHNRMVDITQKYVRKIKIFYDEEVSRYEGVIHNDFYNYNIDSFVDYAYEVSRFLEDNLYELIELGINQTQIDEFNSNLFDLRELNTIYQNKLNKYTETKNNIINNIKNMINKLWL